MVEHTWLIDWIFGHLLYRHKDSVSFSVVGGGGQTMFLAKAPGCAVVVVRTRGSEWYEQCLFVSIVYGSVCFNGYFYGPPDFLDSLWSRVLECARALKEGRDGE